MNKRIQRKHFKSNRYVEVQLLVNRCQQPLIERLLRDIRYNMDWDFQEPDRVEFVLYLSQYDDKTTTLLARCSKSTKELKALSKLYYKGIYIENIQEVYKAILGIDIDNLDTIYKLISVDLNSYHKARQLLASKWPSFILKKDNWAFKNSKTGRYDKFC